MPPTTGPPDAERGPNGPPFHSNRYQEDPHHKSHREGTSLGSHVTDIVGWPALAAWLEADR
jgi:hypothetical protein